MRVLHRYIDTHTHEERQEGRRQGVRSAPPEDEHASDGKEGGHGTPCQHAEITPRPLLGRMDKLKSAPTVQTELVWTVPTRPTTKKADEGGDRPG